MNWKFGLKKLSRKQPREIKGGKYKSKRKRQKRVRSLTIFLVAVPKGEDEKHVKRRSPCDPTLWVCCFSAVFCVQ